MSHLVNLLNFTILIMIQQIFLQTLLIYLAHGIIYLLYYKNLILGLKHQIN